MDLFEKLLAQSKVLPGVWLPFVIVVAILAIAIWRIIDWRYSDRLASKDERIAALGERIEDYKDKLSGATPDEARARITALERALEELKPRQRSLSSEQKQTIADALKGTPLVGFSIIYPDTSHESAVFADDIAEALKMGGWKKSDPDIMIGAQRRKFRGLTLAVPSLASKSTASETLASALDAAGVAFRWEEMPGLSEDRLFVDLID